MLLLVYFSVMCTCIATNYSYDNEMTKITVPEQVHGYRSRSAATEILLKNLIISSTPFLEFPGTNKWVSAETMHAQKARTNI